MPTESTCHYEWLHAGKEIFPAMLAAIDAASRSVCLEIYTFEDSPLGQMFREELVHACERGVHVRVLVDAIGSLFLSDHFWEPLRTGGGEVRWFNPIALNRVTIRDHRKLLLCDGRVAFIGGFNISRTYEGDGVASGWCDLGLKIEGPLVVRLAHSFDGMFACAEFQHKRFMRLRKSDVRKSQALPREQALFSGPGRGLSPIKRALRRDLAQARDVQIVVPYFLPSWRLRQALIHVVKRGGRVQLVLPGKTDVALSKLAAQSVYRRLLRGRVEIYEYLPQILHAKLFVVGDAVYTGSCNLDTRSLYINYELMVRIEDRAMAEQARGIFADILQRCRRVTRAEWRKARGFWQRLKQHWAYFLLNRIDPYVARRQWRRMQD